MKRLLSLIALIAVAVLYYVEPITAGVTGISLATLGGAIGNTNKELYRVNLQKTINMQIWFKSKLSQLLSVIDYDKFKKTGSYGSVKDSYSKLPKQAIVHVIRDLKAKGGVELDVPILVPIKGRGVTGTETLEDTGTPRGMFQSRVAINMKRKALLARDNEMSYQAMEENLAKELMSRDGGDLKDWFSRFLGFEAIFSTLEGYSTNLTDATYGGGYTKRSHPNFYVQGNGKVAFTAFNSAYEDAVATALTTLTDTSTDRFSAQSIKNMVYLASKHKIQPLDIGGKNYFVIFINSAQARNLRQDAEWVGYQKEAASRGSDNTLFTGALEGLPFEGAYIVVDDTIPKARVTGDTGFVTSATTNGLVTGVQYGIVEYMDNPRDEGVRNLAILYGQGGVHFAEGKGFLLTEEIKDHKQKVEVGGRMIYGAARPDIFDHDNYLGGGAGAFVENSSSLVYATHDTDDITI